MKPTLILICTVCPLFLFAQTVNHFENESTKWFVADTYPNANQQNPGFIQTTTTVYGCEGDSAVGGENWLKMYATVDSSFSSNLEYQGLIRSSDGFVLFQDTSNMADTIYNFNMELGDSVLYNFFGQSQEYIHVVDLDSIPINGEMYKRLTFDEPIFGFFLMDEKWIEGIGSVHGPLFPLHPEAFSDGEVPDSLELVCSHVDEILYWDNQFYDACMVNIILDVENAEMSDFNIYPNPATDQIFIRQQPTTSGQFFIRDLLGKVVLSGSLVLDNQPVDISELRPSVYFVTVLFDDTLLTKEILKY